MSKVTWHSGPPPSVGWWPASVASDATMSRWWDGECWSESVGKERDAKYAAKRAAIKDHDSLAFVQWADRPASWPARSRT